MKSCIVSVGVGQRYGSEDFARKALRLKESILLHAPECDAHVWIDEWPPRSPTNKEVPYAFKAYALDHVRKMGYDIIYWLDSSLVLVRDFTPMIEFVQDNGAFMLLDKYSMRGEPYSAGQWMCDHALPYFNLSREDSFKLPQIWAAIMGWNMHDENAKKHLDEYIQLAKMDNGNCFCGPHVNDGENCSKDPRVNGHRHDQTAAAILAYSNELPFFYPPCNEAPHHMSMHSTDPVWVQYENGPPKEKTIVWSDRFPKNYDLPNVKG